MGSDIQHFRAISQAITRRLLTAVVRAQSQVIGFFCWTKWQWCRFSQNTSGSYANSHSANFSKLIILSLTLGARIAQSVQLLATGWTNDGSEFESP
jgi:hypothetical protein